MKKSIFFLLPLFMVVLSTAQVNEKTNVSDKRNIIRELETAAHGNLRQIEAFLKRSTTKNEIAFLTGNDVAIAKSLLGELEHNLYFLIVSGRDSLRFSNSGDNKQFHESILLEKVQRLKQQFPVVDVNNLEREVINSRHSMGIDHIANERAYHARRVDLEKKNSVEMDYYRNDLLIRWVMDEYSRLMGNKATDNYSNHHQYNYKLVQYSVLRDFLREQINRNNKVTIQKTVDINPSRLMTNELYKLMKQIEMIIREEEQQSEIYSRQLIEREFRNRQEYINLN